MSTTQLSVQQFVFDAVGIAGPGTRELRPKLALAVRRQDIEWARAAALDRVMQELLQVRGRAV